MPDITFFNLLKRVDSKKETYPVTVLYGYNEFLGERIIRSYCDAFLEERSDFNYRRFYFDSEYDQTTWEEVIGEANSASFFVQSRKILVATIRDPKKITLNAADKKLLKSYAAKPNPNTLLVIYFSLNANKDDFKTIKTQKINKIIKELSAPSCYTVDLDKISEQEVKGYIFNYLKSSGMSITGSAIEKIFEIKEEDFISILYQLPRLEIAEVEDKSIDSEDVEKVITGVEAHSIWDLTDAIESEDAGKYLRILRYLFMNGIKPTLIIGTLITHYNKLYIAKFLLKRRYPVPEIGRALGQHSFFLNKFINTARSFSDKRLRQIIDLIYKLDFESKTSGEESARLSLQNFTFRIKTLKGKR